MSGPQLKRRITDLEQKLADLQARLPAHSIPTAMMAELEELEEQLEQLRSQLNKDVGQLGADSEIQA
jgi:HAMP domain-containing protein